LIRALVYQYRDFADATSSDAHPKFVQFLREHLAFHSETLLAESAKRVKFSYPDLSYYDPPPKEKTELKEYFTGKLSNASVEDVYAVYTQKAAPQIGFRVSVVFDIVFDTDYEGLRRLFVPASPGPSPFHAEFGEAWQKHADDRHTLPVVLFVGEEQEFAIFDDLNGFPRRLFGPPIRVQLPSGAAVQLERGFPYVTYVVHSAMAAAIPEKIHRCDFAMLMALPGFVEDQMELIRSYRQELAVVQERLGKVEFWHSQEAYNAAWRRFEKIQGLAPTTTAAVQRIIQKYPGRSLFAVIADDNARLIRFTVLAAIAATEQVRANIQNSAQQTLQQCVNNLQEESVKLTSSIRDLQKESINLTTSIRDASRATARATIVLAVAAAITIVLSIAMLLHTAKTEVTLKRISEPLHVVNDAAAPAQTQSGTPLEAVFLFEAFRNIGQQVNVTFGNNVTELAVDVRTPDAAAGTPIEISLLRDGAIVNKGTVAAERPPVGVRVFLRRGFFAQGSKYRLQLSQGSLWSINLPLTVAFRN
jgi:hypothetical protein